MIVGVFVVILGFFLSSPISAQKYKTPSKCSKELAGIVYTPEVEAYKYLERISKELLAVAPLLWTPQNASILHQFENKYGVAIAIADALGIRSEYVYNSYDGAIANNEANGFGLQYQFASTARTVALGTGFEADPYPGLYHYNTLFWNHNGEMFVLGIDLPMSGGRFEILV